MSGATSLREGESKKGGGAGEGGGKNSFKAHIPFWVCDKSCNVNIQK